MNKDFKEYVFKRCEVALRENAKYMELEGNKQVDQDVVQAKAEELCYIKGFYDAMSLLSNQ